MDNIDKIIKDIWTNNIQQDYNNGLILNEDTLKNALYFHLRTYFEKNSDYNNLCIYTECRDYGFPKLAYIPDMIIINKATQKIVAVFELKYKPRNYYYVENSVYYDCHKLKQYIKKLDTTQSNCKYYIAAITLGDFTRANWLDGRSKWAKNKVSELIAYEPNGQKIQFRIILH